ncbi:MAG TPA: SAM-dependent chlorinase/fluorinase, partial [Gemmatimonadales bacterium]|nr:SAM-dependent chlorinase/fluorinase [Gemmatimonadales bacterium]
MAILTFLSDFGLHDSYVAEVKGAVLSRHAGATIVDVTHLVPAGKVASGAFLLGRCFRHFPAGTVHLAVVDPGVGTERAPIALRAHGHYFVGPDNGLFTPVLDAAAEIVALEQPPGIAPTFHGRDLFAPAAARLLMGYPLDTLGTPLGRAAVRLPLLTPRLQGDAIVGVVLHEDHFGSLVTNLNPAILPEGAEIVVDHVTVGPVRRTYAEVEPGALLALVGSAGLVEIAMRDGSAARRLGGGVGHEVRAVPAASRPA